MGELLTVEKHASIEHRGQPLFPGSRSWFSPTGYEPRMSNDATAGQLLAIINVIGCPEPADIQIVCPKSKQDLFEKLGVQSSDNFDQVVQVHPKQNNLW